MKQWLTMILVLAVAPVALAGQFGARQGKDVQIPQDKQAQLLERFGDDGIDANDDGVLTRDEVRDFMKESGLDFGRGRGGRGPGGFGGPPSDRGGLFMIHRLEALQSDTPPDDLQVGRFPGLDADGDGTVSDAEWQAFAEKATSRLTERVLKQFPDADADGDGALSAEELSALKASQIAVVKQRILERHPEADEDGDGVISDEELAAFREDMPRRGEGRGAHRGKHDRGRGGFGQRGRGQGPVSAEVMLERHPEADTDSDGALSAEEMNAFRAERRANRPKRGACPQATESTTAEDESADN